FLAYIFYFFCRHSCINTSCLYPSILRNYCSSSNNTVAFNNTIIHHNATHTNKHIIMYGTAMHNGIMSYGYVVPNVCRMFLISSMYYCAILYIYLMAHFNIMNITSNYCIKPNTTLVTHGYFAYNSSVFCNKTGLWYVWVFSVYRFYNWHGMLFNYKKYTKKLSESKV